MTAGRSHELDLSAYDSDKVESGYLHVYDFFFGPLVGREVTVLELGIHRGGSLLLWRDYFPRGRVFGIDLEVPKREFGERVTVFEGSQDDTRLLDRAAEAAGGAFDIVIDDASHLGGPTKTSFSHLFGKYLKPGGLYVIEDWGVGFWSDWPDGERFDENRVEAGAPSADPRRFRSHDFGIVGFVKQLVDEVAAGERCQGSSATPPEKISPMNSLCIFPGILVCRKRPRPEVFDLAMVDGRP